MSTQTRIHGQFSEQIREGKLVPGDQLPTESEIAREFGVSRSTVQSAMARLATEGWIERFAGRGTFVKRRVPSKTIHIDIHNIQSFESEAALSGDLVTYQMLSFGRSKPPDRAAKKLGITPDERPFELRRLRFVKDTCIGTETRYFSPGIDLAVDATVLDSAPIHTILEEHLGFRIGRIEASLRAEAASPEVAANIGVPDGSPLLVRAHSILSAEGQVLLYGESSYVQPYSFNYKAGLAE